MGKRGGGNVRGGRGGNVRGGRGGNVFQNSFR
jgi:hypothetical protein